MFIIEPLFWMFKIENFKTHFLYLLKFGVVSYALAFLSQYIAMHYCTNGMYFLCLQIISALGIIFPALFLSGYFWCLTDNIIDREQIPQANDIYNGNVNFKNKITLPDLSIKSLLWRGIASIVATIILCVPLMYLLFSYSTKSTTILDYWNVDIVYLIPAGIIAFILVASIVPALLWNYARRDSVFAILNVPKAAYIVSTYPLKYFTNVFLFIIYSLLQSFIIQGLAIIFGITAIFSNLAGFGNFNLNIDLLLFIPLSITYMISIYWTYINAYLLGTIAPPSEY